MRTIIISQADRLKRGKTGMVTASSSQDSYRIAGAQHNMDTWQHGRAVDEVTHFGRHTLRVGDKLAVEDDAGRRHGFVRITAIRMVDTLNLTDADIQALGYDSFAEFNAAEPGYHNRPAWFVSIVPVRRFG